MSNDIVAIQLVRESQGAGECCMFEMKYEWSSCIASYRIIELPWQLTLRYRRSYLSSFRFQREKTGLNVFEQAWTSL